MNRLNFSLLVVRFFVQGQTREGVRIRIARTGTMEDRNFELGKSERPSGDALVVTDRGSRL